MGRGGSSFNNQTDDFVLESGFLCIPRSYMSNRRRVWKGVEQLI